MFAFWRRCPGNAWLHGGCHKGRCFADMLCAVQLLERQEVRDGSNPCIYRIAQEGLPFLLPYVTKQRLRVPLSVFKQLLTARALRIPHSVPYVTVRPPKEDRPKVEGEAKAGSGTVGLEGAGATPTLACEACLAQLEHVYAGCCVITLQCAARRQSESACCICAVLSFWRTCSYGCVGSWA